eukprot:EG_transcript_563
MHLPSPAPYGRLAPDLPWRAGLPPAPADQRYTTAVELAARCCRTAGAALLLVDSDRQLVWKAQWGVPSHRTPEVDAFCQRVLWKCEPIVSADASPSGSCTFWAGAPVLLPEANSSCLGVLAVLDERWATTVDQALDVERLLELLASQVASFISGDLGVSDEWQRMNLFVAKVSHELRTPLNGILGCTTLLQSRLGGSADAETVEGLRHISASAEHNLQTVNQILDFAKLDAGRVELERLPFDLRECVEEAMSMLPVDRKPQDVELGYEMAEDAEVVGDRHRLKQVLLNLLSNALKFTTHGSVVLSVQLQHTSPRSALDGFGPGCIHFTVQDTGPGIPLHEAQTLFRPYSQGSSSTARTHGGTGLGLVVSRMLAEAMGGQLWLESTVGEGSAFHFTAAVPLRPTPARGFPGGSVLLVDDRPARATLLQRHLESLNVKVHRCVEKPELPQNCTLVLVAGTPAGRLPAWPVPWALVADLSTGEDSPRAGGAPPAFVLPTVVSQRRLRRHLEALWTPSPRPHPCPRLPPPPLGALLPTPPLSPSSQWEGAAELAGMRVLVADDVEVNRVVLQGFLKRLDCACDVCENGLETLRAATAEAYHVVILDLEMPVLDGLGAARRVKELPHTPYLVAASSTPEELVRSQCLEAGFDAFLPKPIRFPDLCQVLQDAKRSQHCSSSDTSTSSLDTLSSFLEEDVISPYCVPRPVLRSPTKPTATRAHHGPDAGTEVGSDPSPRRASIHVKVLSSLRATVGLAPKAPIQPPPRFASVVQKSPAPPKAASSSAKRPSRTGWP